MGLPNKLNVDRGLSQSFANDKRIIVYSINIGGYDGDITHKWQVVDAEYRTYKKVPSALQFKGGDLEKNRRDSRVFKLNPKLKSELCEYDYAIYIDSYIRLKGSFFLQDFVFLCSDAPVAMIPHPTSKNISEELENINKNRRWSSGNDATNGKNQVDRYLKNNPHLANVWCGGVIVWNMQHNILSKLCYSLLHEYMIGSTRDQLVFPHVFSEYNISPVSVDIDIFNNHYFEIVPHKK